MDITQVFRSRQHLLEILGEQGYDVEDYNHYSLSMVSSMVENKTLDLQLEKGDKKTFVKYHLDTKLVIPSVVCAFFDGDEGEPLLKKSDDLIIITKADPNDTMIADMNKIWNDSGIYVSVIHIKRLQFNILKHVQVPKHVVLNEEEKQKALDRFHIQASDLPTISRYDPVAQVLCMRPGMVCRIHRKSKTAVESEYFRVCV